MIKLKSQSPALALALLLSASPAGANVVFNLIPESGTPQFAIDGFTTAANRWSSLLANDVTINIQIGFTSLGQFVIGQAGSNFREYSYTETKAALGVGRVSADDYSSYATLQPGAEYQRLINRTSNSPNGVNSTIPYLNTMDRVGMTTANAKALGLLGATTTIDAFLRFNADFSFDFDPSNGINPGQFDFVGASMHEIGHALGFTSGVDDVDQLSGLLPDHAFSSNLIDLFRFSTASIGFGLGVSDYTADNRAKYFSSDGGLTATGAFSTGILHGDGNQASHWKDFLGVGMMDPTAFPGELMTLTATDLRAFDVLGYTLVPEPACGTLLLISGTLLFCRRKR